MKKPAAPVKALKKNAPTKAASKVEVSAKRRRASWELHLERNLIAQGLSRAEARETVEDFALDR